MPGRSILVRVVRHGQMRIDQMALKKSRMSLFFIQVQKSRAVSSAEKYLLLA